MSEYELSKADALVIFGITGDLAKKMTFQALYRMETAKVLDCPIIGVAVNEWSLDQLRDAMHAGLLACGETVKNDVWDYDLGSQPTLINYPTDHGMVPAK